MWIKSLKLNEFGAISGNWDFQQKQLNVIIAPNEGGKTTILNAIIAGLYNSIPIYKIVGANYKVKWQKPSDIYFPWQPQTASLVELAFMHDGSEYLARLNLKTSRQSLIETMQCYKNQTSILSELTQKNTTLGQLVLNFSGDQFLAIVAANRRQYDIYLNADISTLIEQAATSKDMQTTATDAVKKIEAALYPCPYAGKGRKLKTENLIKELNDSITNLESNLRTLEIEKTSIQSEYHQIASLTMKIDELNQKITLLNSASDNQEYFEYKTKLSEENEKQKQIIKLKEYRDFGAHKFSKLVELKGQYKTVEQSVKATDIEYQSVRNSIQETDKKATEFPNELKGILTDTNRTLANGLDGIIELYNKKINLHSLLDGSNLDQLIELSKYFCNRPPSAGLCQVADEYQDNARKIDELRSNESLLIKRVKSGQVKLIIGIILIIIAIGLGLTVGNLLYLIAALGLIFLGMGLGIKEAKKSIVANRQTIDATSKRNKQIEPELQKLLQSYRKNNINEFTQQVTRYAELRLNPNVDKYLNVSEQLDQKLSELTQNYSSIIPEHPTILQLTSIKEQLNRIYDWRQNRVSLDEKHKSKGQELNKLKEHITNLSSSIREILNDSKLSYTGELIRDITIYEEAYAEFERLLKIRESMLTEIEFKRMSRKLEALEKDRKTLGLDKLVPDNVAIQNTVELRQEANKFQIEKDALNLKCNVVMRGIAGKDMKISEQTEIINFELAKKQALLEKVSHYYQALMLAKEVLTEETNSIFNLWSVDLQNVINRNLQNTGVTEKVVELQPETNGIDLNVRHVSSGKVSNSKDPGYAISQGTSDQIQMALRLALAEYLSGNGESLPLILDEPLADYDDDRFFNTMQWLVTSMTNKHQIIMLTCHEQRTLAALDRFKKSDYGLFRIGA